jgi:hypothetical protein
MESKTTQLVLVSRPGLVSNSLLSYCRSLITHNFQSEIMDPAEFLHPTKPLVADVLIVIEEDNPGEVDQIIQKIAAFHYRSIVIVRNIHRQCELRLKTTQPVLVWGLIDQSLAKFLFEKVPLKPAVPGVPPATVEPWSANG